MLWSMINSVAIVLLAGCMLLIIRQVGFILSTLGPTGARGMNQGPRVGENISPFVRFGGARPPTRRATLYLFASTFCPVCKTVREAAKVVARPWQPEVGILMVYDAKATDAGQGTLEPDGALLVTRSCGLREKLDIRTVPYAIMTDPDGVVTGHGLVNNASHLESLLEQWQASRPGNNAGAEGALQAANG
ncbi:MAG: hypothetical protein HYS12_18795 [Planctomycetes bacterium]|nr:hypothetical protein [Planctomycetota bacterium]